MIQGNKKVIPKKLKLEKALLKLVTNSQTAKPDLSAEKIVQVEHNSIK